jgi:O-antigen/teichoic acid export membrane protein
VIIFSVVLILQVPGVASSVYFTSSELVSESMRLVALSATLNVVASVLLTVQVGVIGPALGSLIAASLFDLFLLPRRVARLLGYRYVDMLKRAGRPMLRPTLVLVAVLVLDRQVAQNGIVILPLGALASGAYAITLWLTPEVRQLRHRLRER